MSKMDSREFIDMAVPAYYASKLFDKLRNSISLSVDESGEQHYDISEEYKNKLENERDGNTMNKYAEERECIKKICMTIMEFYEKQNKKDAAMGRMKLLLTKYDHCSLDIEGIAGIIYDEVIDTDYCADRQSIVCGISIILEKMNDEITNETNIKELKKRISELEARLNNTYLDREKLLLLRFEVLKIAMQDNNNDELNACNYSNNPCPSMGSFANFYVKIINLVSGNRKANDIQKNVDNRYMSFYEDVKCKGYNGKKTLKKWIEDRINDCSNKYVHIIKGKAMSGKSVFCLMSIYDFIMNKYMSSGETRNRYALWFSLWSDWYTTILGNNYPGIEINRTEEEIIRKVENIFRLCYEYKYDKGYILLDGYDKMLLNSPKVRPDFLEKISNKIEEVRSELKLDIHVFILVRETSTDEEDNDDVVVTMDVQNNITLNTRYSINNEKMSKYAARQAFNKTKYEMVYGMYGEEASKKVKISNSSTTCIDSDREYYLAYYIVKLLSDINSDINRSHEEIKKEILIAISHLAYWRFGIAFRYCMHCMREISSLLIKIDYDWNSIFDTLIERLAIINSPFVTSTYVNDHIDNGLSDFSMREYRNIFCNVLSIYSILQQSTRNTIKLNANNKERLSFLIRLFNCDEMVFSPGESIERIDARCTTFTYTIINNGSFENWDLEFAKIIHSDIESISFVNTILKKDWFADARIKNVDFKEKTDLTYATFYKCKFENVRFGSNDGKCIAREVSFIECTFNGVEFYDCDLTHAKFDKCTFSKVDFVYVDTIYKSSFTLQCIVYDCISIDNRQYTTFDNFYNNLTTDNNIKNVFADCLVSGNIVQLEKCFHNIINSFSCFDLSGEPERFYHGFVLGLISGNSDKYKINSNRESGNGRYDVAMEPVDRNTGLTPIIIEFKRKKNCDGNLESTAERALKQIEKQKYYKDLIDVSTSKIYLYGFGFEGKECRIKMKIYYPQNEIGDLAST